MKCSNILMFSLIVCFLRPHHVEGKPQLDLRISVELEIGDQCELFDDSNGTCMIDRECPYILELLSSNQKDKIRRCGFSGPNQVVCCGTVKTEISSKSRSSFCSSSLEKVPERPVRFQFHILRGQQAEVSEFPFMASLGYETSFGDYDFKCGGSLISDDFVLTAAHCANREKPKIVRLGKTSLKDDRDEEEAQDIGIQNIIVKPNYSSKSKLNDIALIKLQRPAVLAHNVFPACLSVGDKTMINSLTIIGFGKVMHDDDDSRSDWLMKAVTSEVSIAECQSKYKNILGNKPLTETQLCAFNNTIRSDTCQGDSGGPMFYKEGSRAVLYGITSYGIGCGGEIPSVYTRVDKYLDWIRETMKL